MGASLLHLPRPALPPRLLCSPPLRRFRRRQLLRLPLRRSGQRGATGRPSSITKIFILMAMMKLSWWTVSQLTPEMRLLPLPDKALLVSSSASAPAAAAAAACCCSMLLSQLPPQYRSSRRGGDFFRQLGLIYHVLLQGTPV